MPLALRRGVLLPLVATLVVLTAEPAPSPRRAVSAVGAVSFGAVWMVGASLAALDEVSGKTSYRSLMIPVVGPVLAAADGRNQQTTSLTVLFALTVLQLGALTTTLIGLFLPETEAVPGLRISPLAAGRPGVSFDLRW